MIGRKPKDSAAAPAGTSGPAGAARTRRNPVDHPGAANYPADGARRRAAPTRIPSHGNPPGGNRGEAYLPPRTHNPHLPPLDDTPTDPHDETGPGGHRTQALPTDPAPEAPKKITVARVAAMRSRQLTAKGLGKIHQAATADGADQSGLTALTLPVIVNFAVDAAMAVALANTLFFSAATGQSKVSVALYLALTIAPFALIAPLIGPLLDRLQQGRRIAMAATFGARVVLALLIMTNVSWDPVADQLNYDPWVLYPCALGLLVLSKSFGVLKSAVTPRVVPPTIDLPRVNSRLTMFGLVGGTIIGGAVAGLFEVLLAKALPWHLPGAMLWLAVIAAYGAYLCMRIPSWVEVTEGEIPATLTYHAPHAAAAAPGRAGMRGGAKALAAKMRQPLGRKVVAALWGNGTIRILTGFLTLYIAFYAKSQQGVHSDWKQLATIGAVGAAAGVGNAIGNGVGTRLQLRNPSKIVLYSTAACFVMAVLAAIFGNIVLATATALVASGTSAIGKVCLDSSIQDDLPEQSRASAFGRSETVLQLCWVLGAALGVLLPTTLWVGFTVVSVLLGLGLAQTVLTDRGRSLVPGLGGERPEHAEPTMSFADLGTPAYSHPTQRHAAVRPDRPNGHPVGRPADPASAPTRPHRPAGPAQGPSSRDASGPGAQPTKRMGYH
ncbi:MFS transporter [Gordonia oryzae]|uniref:MFS transporter n=1 Tax=Gordonia oryzae TaxID=2487349 RepID=A0A3N4GCJ5_9ACTN|nr:MFS transporter [Gordonia oryzae]RPA59905.1 MFS transporter [Gordonia oryzae]